VRRVYYLSTCDTCTRIMNEVPGIDSFEKIDIKQQNISEEDLDKAAAITGGYEQIFSKRARKYRGEGHHELDLTEQDYRSLMLQEYTFIKRPFFFVDDLVFVGNTKKVVAALIDYLNG